MLLRIRRGHGQEMIVQARSRRRDRHDANTHVLGISWPRRKGELAADDVQVRKLALVGQATIERAADLETVLLRLVLVGQVVLQGADEPRDVAVVLGAENRG